jgi:hypothetical protein
LWGAATGALWAEEQPSGTVTIDEVQVMLIVGGDHGKGTLHFDGKDYDFKAGGLKLGGMGVHKMDMSGEVYNLTKVDDFPGLYLAAEAGADMDKGAGEIWLKNDKGVRMHLKSKSEGLALSVGVEGFDVSFDR